MRKILRDDIARFTYLSGEDGEHTSIQRIGAYLDGYDRAMQWTPVSEGLPKEKEWIGTKKFGTTKSDNIFITFEADGHRFIRLMSLQNGEPSSSDKFILNTLYEDWKMIAWMPLPQPYRGEREEYELATEQMEHDTMYELTYSIEDGSM